MSELTSRISAWMKKSKEHRPFLLQYRSSTFFITLSVTLAIFSDIFLYAVIVPVMPFALTERSGIDQNNVQYWVSVLVAVYGGALLAASPYQFLTSAFCGWFADRTSSRRFPLLLGLVTLIGATAMLNAGSSVGVLIAGRLLQGISAAMVWSVGLALLVDTVGHSDIGMYMGYVGLAMSLGMLTAPLLGGIVFNRAGYNAVFAMCYGIIGLDVMMRLLLVEKRFARKWIGDAKETPTGVELATIQGDPEAQAEMKKLDPPHQTSNVVDNASSNEHVGYLRRFIHRLPPFITLLASRRLLTALFGMFSVSTLLTSFDAVLPIYVRQTFNWSSIGAGLIFLPIIVPSLIGPLIGHLSDRYGPRWLSVIGFLLAAPFLALLRLVTYNSLRQKVLLCALLALFGLFIDFSMTPLMAEISNVVEAKERKAKEAGEKGFGKRGAYAQAYGLFNCSWAAGALVGPIWAGFLNEKAGWGTMAWSLAVLSAVSAVPIFVWTGGSMRKRGRAVI